MIELLAALVLAFEPAPCELPGEPPGYDAQHGLECGWVTVARTPGEPETIRLWTARVRASEPGGSEDPVLYINGGPGIATIDSLLPALQDWPALTELRRRRDVIFFDQRGTGRSGEALCPELAPALQDIGSRGLPPDEEDALSRAAFVACRDASIANGHDLNAYTTLASVDDVEAIRQAYGADHLNLVAVSYGALIAMQVMRASPQTVRSVILESPYPPNSLSWAEQASAAAAGFQAIDRACSGDPDCSERFGGLMPKLEAVVARLQAEPIRRGERVIDGRDFARALWILAIQSRSVRFVPQAIHRAHGGDDVLIARMVELFGGDDSFGGFSHAQARAIGCHESGRTREWYAGARNRYPALIPGTPDDGWDRLCEAFRPGFADPALFAPVASDIPTLIYAGSFDPATPATDAYQAMRFLPNATLVMVDGASHAPMARDVCTLGIALRFLDAPDLSPDLSCLNERDTVTFPASGLDQMLGLSS